MNLANLNRKVVLVTGAAKGIGKSIAVGVAQNNGIPAIADIDEAALNQTLSELKAICPEATAYVADMGKVGSIQSMVAQVENHYGRLDVVVNNAGILDNTLPEELEEDLWDRLIDINLKGAFFCAKFAYEKMRPRKSGSIINISSVAGRMGGHGVGCAYAASKAGIIGWTMNFARKAAPHGIRVNAIAPGTIESDMSALFTPEQMARLNANIPLGRLGTPREIANMAVLLASDAVAFVTGSVFDINGGMHMG